MTTKVAGKRKSIPISIKQELVEKFEEGYRVIDLAKEYGFAPSTVRTIVTNKEVVKKAKPGGTGCRIVKNKNLIYEMENLLLMWLKEKELKGDTVTTSCICECAKQIYEDLKNNVPGTSCSEFSDFKASNGWFDSFKKRVGIDIKNLGEESSSDDIKESMEESNDEIANLDEDKEETPLQLSSQYSNNSSSAAPILSSTFMTNWLGTNFEVYKSKIRQFQMEALVSLLLKASGPRKNVLLGCTGSVATIKVPEIVKQLKEKQYSVIVVPTECALHFLKAQAIADINSLQDLDNNKDPFTANLPVSTPVDWSINELRSHYSDFIIACDTDEWTSWNKRGDPVLHIELRNWADLCIIAPLDANTLAKMAQGLCDNLLTCVIRAWDVKKPLYFCPAMNTHMYSHPFTEKHIAILKDLGYHEIPSISKTLACGDVGMGAMAEVATILNAIDEYFSQL